MTIPGKGAARPDILVVADEVPAFDRASGSVRFYQMLRMLARRYRVAFSGRVYPVRQDGLRYKRALDEIGVELYPTPSVDVVDKVGEVRLCVLFELFATAARTLGRIRLRRPDLPAIIDSVDVHFLRERRAAAYAKRPTIASLKAAITRWRELGVYSRADLILAVTEADRVAIQHELPQARVAVIPNIHRVQENVPGFEERRRHSMMFVGGFAHQPNVDAMLFFAREVLPLVRRQLPEATLTIVGDRPPPEIVDLAGDGIVVTGWVPEMAPFLNSHCLGIAPLRYGAGMKGKVGEALAAGLPMVTTRIGAEGMDLQDGRTALIADAPEAFAAGIVRICTDAALHERLSKAGQDHVRHRWDIAAVERQLFAAVESVRGVRPRAVTARERADAASREAYVRSGLEAQVARGVRVGSWYASRVSGLLRKRPHP